MSKKQDDFYFQNFIECAGYSCQAAHLLKEILSDFRPEDTRLRLDELHKIEHEADMKKHELSDRLTKAFITPIEREDIAALSEQIDDLTDKIEEVFIRIYINNVKAIRPEALKMLELVIQCCEEVCGLMREFANFRRSKELKDRIIQVNSLEEEADPAVYRQHAQPSFRGKGCAGRHRMEGDLQLSGKMRRCLRACRRRGGERGHEKFIKVPERTDRILYPGGMKNLLTCRIFSCITVLSE